MNGSIETTWDGLKAMAKEFADALPTLDMEQADNGFKCLGIAYLNCKYPEGERGIILQTVEAPALLRIMMRLYFKRQIEIEELKVINVLRTVDMELA